MRLMCGCNTCRIHAPDAMGATNSPVNWWTLIVSSSCVKVEQSLSLSVLTGRNGCWCVPWSGSCCYYWSAFSLLLQVQLLAVTPLAWYRSWWTWEIFARWRLILSECRVLINWCPGIHNTLITYAFMCVCVLDGEKEFCAIANRLSFFVFHHNGRFFFFF